MKNPEFSISAIPSRKLPLDRDPEIDRLIARSVAIDFPARTDDEIARLVESRRVMRRDMNAGVGNAVSARQRYAKAISMLVARNGELVAYSVAADNASSRRGGLMGELEIQAKLHIPPSVDKILPGPSFAEANYRWAGICAIAPEIREEVEELMLGGNATMVDGMIARGLHEGRPDQTPSAFPWKQERLWRELLHSDGYQRVPGEEIPDYPFGGDRTRDNRVAMEYWTAPGSSIAIETIANKHGGERILALAGVPIPE